QAQSRPQSAWQLELVHNDLVVDSASGSGATSTVTLDYRAVEGEYYVVRVRAATGTVWGEWASAPFDVDYLPPAPPVGSGVWSEDRGVVELGVQTGEDEDAPETVELSVERSVD